MKNIKALILFSLIVFVSSCEEPELPVEPVNSGEVEREQLNMQSNYEMQLYYDLETNSVVKENSKLSWDIAFQMNSEYNMVLNGARASKIAFYEGLSFADKPDTTDSKWSFDASSGNLDSTAAKTFLEKKGLFVLDRGYDPKGKKTGYRKFTIEIEQDSYKLQYGKFEDTEPATTFIEKDSTYNFVSFSFKTNSVYIHEPARENWDLLFSQYTHLFEDPPIPYLVTGVLINPYKVAVSEITDIEFKDISLEDAQKAQLSRKQDIIGYDWKFYSFDEAAYLINSDKTYVIRDTEGFFYKLRFIGFTDENGERGAPEFEVQRL